MLKACFEDIKKAFGRPVAHLEDYNFMHSTEHEAAKRGC